MIRPRLPGFRFAETMAGTATLDGEQQPMRFDISVEGPSLLSSRAEISGTVTIGALAHDAALRGRLWLNLLLWPFRRRIRYEFEFHDDNGRPLSFAGQKDLSIFHPLRSIINLPGEIVDERGGTVARAELRFSLWDLPSFVASFRPVW